jgi:hypothetical protein
MDYRRKRTTTLLRLLAWRISVEAGKDGQEDLAEGALLLGRIALESPELARAARPELIAILDGADWLDDAAKHFESIDAAQAERAAYEGKLN